MMTISSTSRLQGSRSVPGWVSMLLLAIALTVAAFLLPRTQLSVFGLFLLYWVGLMGVNVMFGYAGQFNLAQNTLFGAGAFGYAIAVVTFGAVPLVAAVAGTVVAIVLAVAMSAIAGRVRGLPLAVLTLGIALATPDLFSSTSFTGGFDGVSGIPRPSLLGLADPSDRQLLALFGLAGVALFAMLRGLLLSSWGVAFKSMATDEEAAAALGISPVYHRTLAFALGGALVGFAGVMYAAYYGYVGYLSFTVTLVILWYLGVVLGGAGSLWGPLMGAFIIAVIPNRLPIGIEWQPVLWGAFLIAVLAIAPHGLAAALAKLRSNAMVGTAPGESPAEDQPMSPEDGGAARDPSSDTERREAGSRRSRQRPDEAVARSAGGAVLRTEGVGLEIGDFTILHDVGLTLRAGQVHALLGANGAGKSSLVNIITGYLRPTTGQIWLGTDEIHRWSPAQVRAAGVSRTFQHGRLMLEETVFVNVLAGLHASFHPTLWGASLALPSARSVTAQQHAQVQAILERLGVARLAGELLEELPMGVRQMVSVARAMIGEPDVLLLDEPIAGLNNDEVGSVVDAVRAVSDTGVAVLLIEHRLDFVRAVAEEATCLDAGRVIAAGATHEVLASPAVQAAFLGKAQPSSPGTRLAVSTGADE